MKEDGKEPVPDTPALGRKADSAVRAFWNQTSDWRSLWIEVFDEWAAEVVRSHERQLPHASRLAAMLWLMADALADGAVGVPHPFLALEARRAAGSPRSNVLQRSLRRTIALLVAYKMAGKNAGMSDLDCYKSAAAHARRFGAPITWQQARSAWQNHSAYPSVDLTNIERHQRELRQTGRSMRQLTEVDDLLAQTVAFYMRSPLTKEPRGGARKRSASTS